MCMLSYIPPGTDIVTEELENGAEANPDGHGWAAVNARRRTISVHRTMDPDEAIETLVAARKRDNSGPALFHSRIATSGLINITGVHPYRVGQDTRTVVGHNGILFDPGDSSRKSDTAIFAESVLPRFGSLDKRKTIRKIEKYIGPFNKLVILTVNPARRAHAYILNEPKGTWSSKSGAWHSNTDYMGWFPKYRVTGDVQSYSSLWRDDETETPPWDKKPDNGMSPWACQVCNQWNCVDKITNICEACRACNDCFAVESLCMCWLPPEDRARAVVLENRALTAADR